MISMPIDGIPTDNLYHLCKAGASSEALVKLADDLMSTQPVLQIQKGLEEDPLGRPFIMLLVHMLLIHLTWAHLYPKSLISHDKVLDKKHCSVNFEQWSNSIDGAENAAEYKQLVFCFLAGFPLLAKEETLWGQ